MPKKNQTEIARLTQELMKNPNVEAVADLQGTKSPIEHRCSLGLAA